MPYKPAIQDRVWNRALLEEGGPSPRKGDAALAAMLLVHSIIMNGGVGHALEALREDEIAAGIEGYHYFDLPNVASILVAAKKVYETGCFDENAEEKFNNEYYTITESIIFEAFVEKMKRFPEDFAPLE